MDTSGRESHLLRPRQGRDKLLRRSPLRQDRAEARLAHRMAGRAARAGDDHIRTLLGMGRRSERAAWDQPGARLVHNDHYEDRPCRTNAPGPGHGAQLTFSLSDIPHPFIVGMMNKVARSFSPARPRWCDGARSGSTQDARAGLRLAENRAPKRLPIACEPHKYPIMQPAPRAPFAPV
ncbi:MAG: hypothetical protein QOI57_2887 [Rubrobacteraceae bacterium]|nr:hypothetical protein [Rubrobacteraceae bacterium]